MTNDHAVDLSVVVPVFNDGPRIAATVRALRQYLPQLVVRYEIRIVDDGSTDATAAIVEELAHRDPQIVLQRELHRGKGGAVRAGLCAARGELRFMCDADLSMPLTELPRFLALVPAQCDIAIACREGPGALRIGEPAYRHIMGRAFNALVRATLLPGIHDSQCGFKLFTRQAVDAVFPRVAIDGWAFDVEALYVAQRRRLRVCQVPIEWRYAPTSHVSALRDSLRMTRDVLRIARNARRGVYD